MAFIICRIKLKPVNALMTKSNTISAGSILSTPAMYMKPCMLRVNFSSSLPCPIKLCLMMARNELI